MVNLTTSMTFKNKRSLLIFIYIGLFLFLIYRGIEFNFHKQISDRIRFHAIPIAISVLYHHHPHDYTGLRAIAFPFQSHEMSINHKIKHAKKQVIGADKSKYYWVADDKGFEDFVIAAFYIFGPHVTSLYWMWFLTLLTTSALFLFSFRQQLFAHGFLCLILLSVHFYISTAGLTLLRDINMTIYEPRCLEVLALVPVIHMMLLAWYRRSLTWLKDIFPLLGQIFLFIFLYHARSSLGWEIVAITFFCLMIIGIRLYKNYKKMIKGVAFKNYISNFKAAIIVVGLLFFGLIDLHIYKHLVYNRHYFAEMGYRTFWHNALIGLTDDPQLRKEYGVGETDKHITAAVIKYAQESKKCTSDIEKSTAQGLLNTFGGHGVANWPNYENCARQLYFTIISKHAFDVFKLYGIKSHQSFLRPFISMEKINDHTIDQKSKIGWHPLNCLHIGIFLLIALFTLNTITRARIRLLAIAIPIYFFSFIPSVSFYLNMRTASGLFVSTALLIYLITLIGIKWIVNCFHQLRKSSRNLDTSLRWHDNVDHANYPIPSKKLSIVIPAYNEENKIHSTIQEVHEAAKKTLDEFEIIVIDDGSLDSTYTIAKSTANNFGPNVRVIAQEKNAGVGAAFHLGLSLANYPQICLIPGDNAYNVNSIESFFANCGKAPLVISYRQNMETRTPLRHFLSRLLTFVIRIITNNKIKDAHGLYLFPVAETRLLKIRSTGYNYHIETLSQLLTLFSFFLEVPVKLNPKPDASSGVMKPKTFFIFSMTLCKLLWLKISGRLAKGVVSR